MIVFRTRNGRRERRAGIDFDPLRQSFDDVIASMEGHLTPGRETDDSVEILVHIGDAPLLMSRESNDWPRLARLGSALLREVEDFDRPAVAAAQVSRLAG